MYIFIYELTVFLAYKFTQHQLSGLVPNPTGHKSLASTFSHGTVLSMCMNTHAPSLITVALVLDLSLSLYSETEK